jgi:hypothetical protein
MFISPPAYLAICLFLSVTLSTAKQPSAPCANQPLFSALSVEPESAKKKIQSPDGQSWITVALEDDPKDPDGLYTRVTVTRKGKRLSARLDGFRSEILWAGNSRSFIVNQTEGGGGFGQRAYLFQITSNGLHKIDLSAPVERAFGFAGDCELRVLPQTAALGWLAADRILMAAEVVNVSVCKYPGTFKTYELSLPSLHVVASHTQRASKRLFPRLLGCELRDANDRLAAKRQK